VADQPAVPAAPALSARRNVDLLHAGTWDASTGTWTATPEDLASAVAALDCPAVRRPPLKLGHADPRFDGEPAVGWIDNMVLTDDGNTLVGDYVGMPGWLGDVIASAYPDRSIEGYFDFRCQLGHTHPFVLTAVALLGVAAPAVALGSLQDVATLYGVAASADTTDLPGTHVALIVNAKGAPMPNPNPLPIDTGSTTVAAGVTTEDVRRAYYDGVSWSQWITEMELDPLQLIVMDDDTGGTFRVPVSIDGETPAFADPVEVSVTYVDKKSPSGVAAMSRRAKSVVFASRAESRPDAPPKPPASPSASGPSTQEKEAVVPETTTSPPSLRSTLGLPDDATDEQMLAAHQSAMAKLAEQPTPPTPPVPPTPAPDEPEQKPAGAVEASIPASVLKQIEDQSKELAEIKAARQADTRRALFDSAVRAGKLRPADRTAWEGRYDKAPEVISEILAATAPNSAVPVDQVGVPGGDETKDIDAEFAHLYPPAFAGQEG